jgi:hypothetical protein
VKIFLSFPLEVAHNTHYISARHTAQQVVYWRPSSLEFVIVTQDSATKKIPPRLLQDDQ